MKMHHIALFALLGSSPLVSAAPISFNSPNVDISLDTDNFQFDVEARYFISLPNTLATVNSINNGFELDFGNNFYVSASGDNSTYELHNGYFNVPMNFTALPGYAIESYTITYSGTYTVINAGGVGAGGPGNSFSFDEYFGPGAYNQSFSIPGTVDADGFAGISGSMFAYADHPYIEVLVGTAPVFSHYEDILLGCNDEGICEYYQSPVYIELPVYMNQGVIGESSLTLSKITVVANVTAVPEADTYALLLAGLGIVGFIARRRKFLA